MIMYRLKIMLIALYLFLPSGQSVLAQPQEHTAEFGDYLVRYSAALVDELPRLKEKYGLVEAADHAILVITVQPKDASRRDLDPTLKADVRARANNLKEKSTDIEMKEIVTNQYTSYVGTLDVSHREYVDFMITVQPQGDDQIFRFRFREQFFTRRS